MKSRDKIVLSAILQHTKNVIKYSEMCMTFQDFQDNGIVVDACVFNLMQIGELAKQQLSDEAKNSITTLPWRELYGLRNRIVHGYQGIKLNIVWETIKNDIPKVALEIQKALTDTKQKTLGR